MCFHLLLLGRVEEPRERALLDVTDITNLYGFRWMPQTMPHMSDLGEAVSIYLAWIKDWSHDHGRGRERESSCEATSRGWIVCTPRASARTNAPKIRECGTDEAEH